MTHARIPEKPAALGDVVPGVGGTRGSAAARGACARRGQAFGPSLGLGDAPCDVDFGGHEPPHPIIGAVVGGAARVT